MGIPSINGLTFVASMVAGLAIMSCQDNGAHSGTDPSRLASDQPRLASGDLGLQTCKARYNASISNAISAAHAMRRRDRMFDDSVLSRVEPKLQGRTHLVRYLRADATIVSSPESFPVNEEIDIDQVVSFDDRVHRIDMSDALACRTPTVVAMERSFGDVPKGLAIIHYKMRAESLLLGLSIGSDFYAAEVLLPASDIAALASNWVSLLSKEKSGNATQQRYAEALFRIFIGPVKARISDASTIAVIPDRFMRYIPFAGLRDPSTGHPVVSNHAIVTLPSPNIIYLARNQRRSRSSLDFLGVGGVVVDRAQFPRLNALPSSIAEIEQSAKFYLRHQTLLGTEAGADSFCSLADASRVVHVATHGLANENSPLRSRMLFTRTGGESFLNATQLSRCRFSAANLIILAACDSSFWYWKRTRGYAWVTPLHAVGVPSVLASLWEVEDRASARFLSGFHEGYSSGLSAAKALQLVQIREIQLEAKSPWRRGLPVWMTYQLLIGSLAQ